MVVGFYIFRDTERKASLNKAFLFLLCLNYRLVDLLAHEPSTKRRSVLEHMTASLQPILEKGIIDHSIIHRALIEYLSITGKVNNTFI